MTGFYDIHTHILPGIDDGSESMQETKKLLEQEYQDGVRTIYATSHYRRGMFEPSMEKIQKQYECVKQAAFETGKDLRIFLGCEFHANMDMVEMLDQGKRPTLGDTCCVLVEFSEAHDCHFIKERCYSLLSHGYQPIIAHAERYTAVRKDMDFLERLVDMGVYIQVNAQSILGKDGLGTKRFCKKAMKADLIHFVASDCHNMGRRKPLLGSCAAYIEKNMGQAYMEKLFIENPKNLIEEGR